MSAITDSSVPVEGGSSKPVYITNTTITLNDGTVIEIGRTYQSTVTTIEEDEATSYPPVDMRGFAGGSIIFPYPLSLANIGFLVFNSEDGEFVPLLDESGELVLLTNIPVEYSSCFSLPDELFGCYYFKLQSYDVDGSGDLAPQSGLREFIITLKG